MKTFRKIFLLLLSVLFLCGCQGKDDLLLHLTFDEGSGTVLTDASGHVQEAELSYLLTNPVYTGSQDPQWRKQGVEGGCLLFDGCSNVVTVDSADLTVEGEALTVSAWVAPRAFEWDDPNAPENNAHLTAIAGQYHRGDKFPAGLPAVWPAVLPGGHRRQLDHPLG